MRHGGSRILILVLIIVATVIALTPVAISRWHGVQVMRMELQGVLTACRARYGAALNAGDSVRVDAWVPHASEAARVGDPPCGSYRRRSMLGRVG